MDEQTLLLTAAIVQLVKEIAGIKDKPVIILSFVVGAALAACQIYAAKFYDETLPILITGLAASGFYDLAKSATRGALSRLRWPTPHQ
jgi:hypothetical protein